MITCGFGVVKPILYRAAASAKALDAIWIQRGTFLYRLAKIIE
jgi:hypothetical protein